VAQGHVLDTIELTSDRLQYLQAPLLLRNVFGHFVRPDAGNGSVPSSRWPGRGTAFGDLDNDGDVDIVVATCGDRAHVLRNDGGNRAHWLTLSTVGLRSNRDGVGATIVVTGESGTRQYFAVTTGSSYLSASDKRVHVGLGADTVARSITIRWPSGLAQTLREVAVNRALTLNEADAR
jgi:hypothetical protein